MTKAKKAVQTTVIQLTVATFNKELSTLKNKLINKGEVNSLINKLFCDAAQIQLDKENLTPLNDTLQLVFKSEHTTSGDRKMIRRWSVDFLDLKIVQSKKDNITTYKFKRNTDDIESHKKAMDIVGGRITKWFAYTPDSEEAETKVYTLADYIKSVKGLVTKPSKLEYGEDSSQVTKINDEINAIFEKYNV